jgi:hypothetical protein
LPVSGELRVGGRFHLGGNASGTIERCDPPIGLRATWEFGGAISWIEVRLTAVDEDTTRLELEHLALVDDDTWAQAWSASEEGRRFMTESSEPGRSP